MKHQEFLKEVYIGLVSQGSYPALSMLDLSGFVQRIKLIEGVFTMQVVDRLFISANFQQPENPKFNLTGNTLARFEFWELLVRISNNKYRESGQVATYSEALEKLIVEKIIPFSQPEPYQSWRDKELWQMDIHDLFDANIESLKKIYLSYYSSVKKYVSLEDIVNLFMNQCPQNLNESDLQFCFGMSKMMVTNEPLNYRQYQMMLFPEFLELIGRVAEFKYKNVPELAANPLVWKIDSLLDEMMPCFGLKKNEVNVEVEENSESDDDY